MECSNTWKLTEKAQLGGLTWSATYDHKDSSWSGWIDWGEVMPNLSIFTSSEFNNNNSNFENALGFVYNRDCWGGVGEFSEDQDQCRHYREKAWYENGPLSIGTNVDLNLNDFSFCVYNAMIGYQVNDSLGVWVGHESCDD